MGRLFGDTGVLLRRLARQVRLRGRMDSVTGLKLLEDDPRLFSFHCLLHTQSHAHRLAFLAPTHFAAY